MKEEESEADEGNDQKNVKVEISEEDPAEKKVPVLKNAVGQSSDVQPVLYSFKILERPSKSGGSMVTNLPPVWLYNDHAFGVIWLLFCQNKRPVGISQLHWCLKFLLDLKNSEGEYTKDVNTCIQMVQDALIENYAKLGTILGDRIPESLDKSEISPKIETTGASPEEASGEGNPENVKLEMDPPLNEEQEEPPGLEMDSKKDVIPASTETGEDSKKDLKETPEVEICGENSRCAHTGRSSNSEALSITYNEMLSRGKDPCTEQFSITEILEFQTEAEFSQSVVMFEKLHEESLDVARISASDVGKSQLVKFLQFSRDQHVSRIKKELENLQGLEKFMRNLDKDLSTIYITDDLVQRLNDLDKKDPEKKEDQ